MREQALVLFSGGQDSTTCLAWALANFARVETVGFSYGQRHARRARLSPGRPCRAAQALSRVGQEARRGSPARSRRHRLARRDRDDEDIEIGMTESGLPNTLVPGRNLLFFTAAAALAYRRGIRTLVGGMCETDFSGYPDCRDDTIKALQVALGLGMDRRFVLETPLMWIDKAGTFALAEELGGKLLVELILSDTHTCYLR